MLMMWCVLTSLQEAMQDSAEAQARVLSLESKLKVVVAEVDRIQEQAALTARLQVRLRRSRGLITLGLVPGQLEVLY